MTQTVLLRDVVQINPKTQLNRGTASVFVSMDKLDTFKRKISSFEKREFKGGSKFINGDALLARITPCLENGKTAYVDILEKDQVGAGSTEFIVLRAIDGITDSDYIYYLSTSPEFRAYAIQAMIGTSGRQRVQNDVLARYEFELPNIATQQQIGKHLRTIDEKIELNRQMNETLEQMGQALFRHYFIDNPEAKKWDKRPLGDFVDLVNGASYESSELKPSMNALVTLKSIGRGGGFSRRGYKEFTGRMKDTQIVIDGDLVVAHTDLTQKAEVAGYPAIIDGADQYKQVVISMDLVKVIPRDQELSTSVVYFLLKTQEFQDYKMGFINGSTVLHLNKKCIPSYAIAFPSNVDTLREISSNFDGLMEKIKVNNQEVQTLTNLRDTLLPRLISGKIIV
jgi:type I restriction enzyme S subunit